MSIMPLVVDGKVMLGTSGGELGVRGFVAAYRCGDRQGAVEDLYGSGARRARQRDLAGRGDHWKTGGGSIWVTGTYDPETNLAFWGTGNGGPWMGDQRPGDNLYTSSVVALDGTSGAIKGHFQYHQNDSWDWDEVSPPILVDYKHDGKDRERPRRRRARRLPLAARAYRRTRSTSSPASRSCATTSSRASSPRPAGPTSIEDRKPGTNKTANFCPSLWGGKDWPPVAYSPQDAAALHPRQREPVHRADRRDAEIRARRALHRRRQERDEDGRRRRSHRRAAGVESRHRQEGVDDQAAVAELGSRCSRPAADVLFAGGTNDRMFRAFDAKTGQILWEFPTRSGVTGVPVSFQVDGKQYIAVQSGWGVDPAQHAGAHEPALPRQVSGGAAGRRDLGVRGEVTEAGFGAAATHSDHRPGNSEMGASRADHWRESCGVRKPDVR